MDYGQLSTPAVVLVVIASTLMMISRNWRWQIGSLGLMYLGAFVLVSNSWPADLAVVKLVTGWMAASVLGVTNLSAGAGATRVRGWPTESIFRFLLAMLIVAAMTSFVPQVLGIVPAMSREQAWGGLILIGMGLLHLGFSARSLRVTSSLLTMLAGFEILYAVVEVSTLVAGLLALVNLGIALAGSYLMVMPLMEEANP